MSLETDNPGSEPAKHNWQADGADAVPESLSPNTARAQRSDWRIFNQ